MFQSSVERSEEPLEPDYRNVASRQLSEVCGLSTSTIPQRPQQPGSDGRCVEEEIPLSDTTRKGPNPPSLTLVCKVPTSSEVETIPANSASSRPKERHVDQTPENLPGVPNLEALGSSLRLLGGCSDAKSSSAKGPDKLTMKGKRDDTDSYTELRSAEAKWNEQVLKHTLEQSPSLQLRILDVFSSKRRQMQRNEEQEIAQALAAYTSDTDVVMFQRRTSALDDVLAGESVPVVAFDVIQREGNASLHHGSVDAEPTSSPLLPEELRSDSGVAFNETGIDLNFTNQRPEGTREHGKENPRDSLHRSWLWTQNPPRLVPNSTSSEGGNDLSSPKCAKENGTDGYECFLQDAEQDTSQRQQFIRSESRRDETGNGLDF